MSKRAVIGYWLLILLPTAMICGYAWHMLTKTGARIETSARETAHQQVRTLAEGMQLAITSVEAELQTSLRQLAGQDPLPVLQSWVDENPLVRNVFVWQPPDVLVYPPAPPTATTEEHRFQLRYQGLFNGRIPWPATHWDPEPGHASTEVAAAPTSAIQGESKVALDQAAPTPSSGREAVIQLARSSRPPAPSTAAKASAPEAGWIPWFTENRLHLLGWSRGTADGPVYGIELELIALLSRLIPDMGADFARESTIALLDDQGRIWHQTGNGDPEDQNAPTFTASLSPALPHWQIAWYEHPGGLGQGASRQGLLVMGSLMLITFSVAILMGTLLLTRQARRHWQDARKKTTFVSNVSHELKTPLTSIRMYAELLESKRVTDTGKQQRYLDIIAKESRRLTRLVDNVLDFARLEQDRKQYRKQRIALAPFLDEFINAQSLRLQEAGFTVNTQYPADPVEAWADRDALNQICLNLLDNGLKYAAPGLRMDLTVHSDGSTATIRFVDYGPGIPSTQSDKIFEKFHRGDSSLTTRNSGSGLGLSIARGLARGMGGDLTYRPRDKNGSCFALSLPVAEKK